MTRRETPPLRLSLAIEGVGVVELEIDIQAEPEVGQRIGELADAGGYVGGEVRRKAYWAQIDIGPNAVAKKAETRRVIHSKFEAGTVGWSWAGVPSRGDGSLFVTFDRQPGLDAPYAMVGRVIAGLELLKALPAVSTLRIKGQPIAEPAKILAMRRLETAPA